MERLPREQQTQDYLGLAAEVRAVLLTLFPRRKSHDVLLPTLENELAVVQDSRQVFMRLWETFFLGADVHVLIRFLYRFFSAFFYIVRMTAS